MEFGDVIAKVKKGELSSSDSIADTKKTLKEVMLQELNEDWNRGAEMDWQK